MNLPRIFVWMVCLTSVVYMTGCKNEPAGETKKMEQAAEDKHDHDDHEGHDHGHEHAHGPHDGHVIELGDEEYHAEVTLDEKSKKLTVYVYGPLLKKSVAIDQKEIVANLTVEEKPTVLKLAAVPQDGDAEGKSSRFEVTLKGETAEHIHDAEELEGTIKLKINGDDFEGAIEHDHGHDHGDHDHDDHDDHDHKDGDHDHDDKDHDHKDEDHDHKDDKK
jgi:hypothetical protein